MESDLLNAVLFVLDYYNVTKFTVFNDNGDFKLLFLEKLPKEVETEILAISPKIK